MANKKDTVAITFRCSTSVCNQLDELCRMAGIKRSEFITACVTTEYDKMQGNPKLKEIMEQFRSISEQMKELTGQGQAGNGAIIGAGNVGEV